MSARPVPLHTQPLTRGRSPSSAGGSSLAVHELCHDVLREVGALEDLLVLLPVTDEQQDVRSALVDRLLSIRDTLGEAQRRSQPRDVPLRALVRSAARSAGLSAAHEVEVEATSELVVTGVPSELRRVVERLMDDAMVAAPRAGVPVALRRDGDEAVLTVSSQGSGPAFASVGTVSMAADIAHRHGGRLSQPTGPGGAATVQLRLPLSVPAEGPPSLASSEA